MYDAAAASVVAVYDSLPAGCSADICPRADFVDCIVRFVVHTVLFVLC